MAVLLFLIFGLGIPLFVAIAAGFTGFRYKRAVMELQRTGSPQLEEVIQYRNIVMKRFYIAIGLSVACGILVTVSVVALLMLR